MDNKDNERLKHFSIKAREGYVLCFDELLGRIMSNKGISRPEAFEVINKIALNAINKEASIKQLEEIYGIDLQMSDNDIHKPSPYRW